MTDLADIPFVRIDGTPATLRDYAGRVVLIVNVASKCGLTPQYKSLEAFYRTHRDAGFEILGFPANNFGAQEPGTNEEIASFCSLTYDVTFPMFAKISVKGKNRHPLYAALITALPKATTTVLTGILATFMNFSFGRKKPDDVMWNFEKFLLSADGKPVARFAPDVTVDDAALRDAIVRELAAAKNRFAEGSSAR